MNNRNPVFLGHWSRKFMWAGHRDLWHQLVWRDSLRSWNEREWSLCPFSVPLIGRYPWDGVDKLRARAESFRASLPSASRNARQWLLNALCLVGESEC